jgi:hypothetical protein
VSKLLAALALVMTFAQASGALALWDVDFCATSCAGELSDPACPPSADCCACCASVPGARAVGAADVALQPPTFALAFARPLRLPPSGPADVFHVPLPAAA